MIDIVSIAKEFGPLVAAIVLLLFIIAKADIEFKLRYPASKRYKEDKEE